MLLYLVWNYPSYKVTKFLSEKKEVRSLAAFGIIHVVRTTWLEDCAREKKEIHVDQRHIAHDLLLPKGLFITLLKPWLFFYWLMFPNLYILLLVLEF